MSATLDGARVARLLGESPVIESEGRAYPVETRYLGRDPNRRIEEQVADAVLRALRAEGGSILVFLPGQGEIRRVDALLRERIGDPAVDVAPLYGALDRGEQDLAVGPARPGRRKIVLATSIAETSLTIEGVRVVVDSGLARVPVYEPDIGLTRLETVRVSRAAADQRRGRAGRTEPGICYRLWEEAATGALEAYARPEILSADLAPLLLDCAAWGVADPTGLAFLDPPPAPALKEARGLLRQLHALDEGGRITDTGRRLRDLPLPPRLARMVLAAGERGQARDAADVAAVLVERGLGGDGADLAERVERFRRDRSRRAEDMRRMAEGWARGSAGSRSGSRGEAHSIGALLTLAYPDRIARARGKTGEYLMANGRGAALEAHERLAREPYLAIAEVTGAAASARILAAAPITPDEIEALVGEDIEQRREVSFDRGRGPCGRGRCAAMGPWCWASVPCRSRPRRRPPGRSPRPRLPGPRRPALVQGPGAVARAGDVPARGGGRGVAGPLRRGPDRSGGGVAGAPPGGKERSERDRAGYPERGPARAAALEPPAASRPGGSDHMEVPTGSQIPVDYGAEEGPFWRFGCRSCSGWTGTPPSRPGACPSSCISCPRRSARSRSPATCRGSGAAPGRRCGPTCAGSIPSIPWPEDPLTAPPTRRAKPRGT
jgi:ATP-dependent helicase HrpB